MTIRETLAELGEDRVPESLSEDWATSMNEMPSDLACLLDPKVIAESRAFAGLPASMDALLGETLAAIQESPALKRLFWHTYRCAYLGSHFPSFEDWPALENALGGKRRLFYLIVALDSIPLTRTRHRKLHVSKKITLDTCRDIALKCESCAILEPNLPGLQPHELNWLRRHVNGEVFTLGRFQYGRYPYRGGAEVFRNDTDDQVLALAPPDQRYDAHGFQLSDGEPLSPGGWISRLTVGEGDIRGHPISPRGFVLPTEITLPAGLWRRILSTGDPVLEIHIPAGGEMTPDKCLASLKQADRFYRKIFSGRLFRAFVCYGWCLGPRMNDILHPSSNIIRFRRQGYLFPVCDSSNGSLRFIFGTDTPATQPVPRDTRLRRNIIEYLEQGGNLTNGAMFLLPEDLPRYGNEPYLTRWGTFEKQLDDL